MSDLNSARDLWINERPGYEAFGKLLKMRFEQVLSDLGIQGDVECRAKSLQSLLGKLITKPDKTYHTVMDKLGLRIVVHFQSECETVLERLRTLFKCENVENTATRLEENEVGYLGTHLDLTLLTADTAAGEFIGLSAEVQVRTLAQHVWAVISHQLAYKVPGNSAPDIARRVMLTSGALELIDAEFGRLHDVITSRPEYREGMILNVLEREFFRVEARPYNRDLSLEVIHVLLPLYALKDPEHYFHYWFEQNEARVRELYLKLRNDYLVSSPFLLQPEAFMILDGLQHDRFRVRDLWKTRFPERELEIFANYWGRSLY